jgi:hypothetical protein
MKMRWAWMSPVLSCLAVALDASTAGAQGYAPPGYGGAPPMYYAPAAMAPPGMMPPGLYPAAYGGPTPAAPGQFAPLPGAMAGPAAGPMPGAPLGPMPGAMPMSPDAYGGYGEMPLDYGMGPIDTGCPYCGGRGCDACQHLRGPHKRDGLLGGVYSGFCADLCGLIGPYPDGGCAAIRWFDVAVDYMSLRRDDAGSNIMFASSVLGGPDAALETNDIDFDYEPSFRFTGVFQAGPGSNVEFTYYGLFNYNEAVDARSPTNELFSVYTNFGTIPVVGGLPETDFSNLQRIEYSSTFDSFEVNFRQRWISANCRYQGSWLFGVRHFILDENFRYFTRSGVAAGLDPLVAAQSNTTVSTGNNLTGAQLGGDIWICLVPGLRLGVEGKAGVYGNNMNANTTITVNTLLPPDDVFREHLDDTDVAFIGDANFLLTYRLSYQWTLRGGYQLLYVDGVALASENFNPTLPNLANVNGLIRQPAVNDNGNVFYHGWNVGLEFNW